MGVKAKVAGGVVVGLLLGGLAGAVALAWWFPPVDTSPIDNATKSLLVTAAVESQPIRELYSLSAQVSAEQVSAIMPTAGGSGGRLVVSGKVHAPGDVIHYGDVIAELSGRPVFAVPSALPLYRDISRDETGSDISGVQHLLADLGLYNGSVDGKATTATLTAIASLYTRAGYPAPNPAGLLMTDTAAIPADALVVAEAAPSGQEVTAEKPLMTVVTAPAVISARVDLLQAPAFTQGTTVEVKVGSADPVASTVAAVGAFDNAALGEPPGYDITVTLPEGVDPVAAAQSPVTVSESGQVDLAPAVPLSAIHRDATGATYVLLPVVPAGATPGQPRQVSVSVTGQSAGWAIIGDNPDLPVGTQVIVSGG